MTGGPITPLPSPGLRAPAIPAAVLKEIGQQLAGTVGGEPLAAGQVVTGRVVEGPQGEPMLLLAGVRVPAQLPGALELGQALRLRVTHSSPERVVLAIVDGAAGEAGAAGGVSGSAPAGAAGSLGSAAGPAATMAPSALAGVPLGSVPWALIPLPGGGQAQLWLDEDGAGEDQLGAARAARPRTMVVRYDSPVLGRTDVVLRLEPGQLDATVLARSGLPLELVRAAVGALRFALAGAVDRPVALTTGGRPAEEVDLRA